MSHFLFGVAILLIVLGVLIFVHELGHFLAAKWAGIRVHRFSLGMGSPVRALTVRRGHTEYAIAWLPLGGYVKMATAEEDVTSSPLEGGRVEEPVPPEEYFEAKPVWKRMIVILAGVSMNVLFAFLVYTGLAWKNGRQVDWETRVGRVVRDSLPAAAQALLTLQPGDRILTINGDTVHSWDDVQADLQNASGSELRIALADGRQLTLPVHVAAVEDRGRVALAVLPYRAPVLDSIIPGRPAAQAGLRPGDTVVAVDDRPVEQWWDLVERIRASAGVRLRLTVARPGGRQDFTLTPIGVEERDVLGHPDTVGKIGVGVSAQLRRVNLDFPGAVREGALATVGASTQIVRTVQGLLSGRVSRRDVGGPILIGQMAAQQARVGVENLIAFMAFVSVNLAVLNLLPIPVLDGGQFLFLVAELVYRRPLPLWLRERLTAVGLVLIGLLMILAFSNDIRRWLGI